MNRPYRAIGSIVGAAALALVWGGCGGGAGEPAEPAPPPGDTTAPVLHDFTVSPDTFAMEGGHVLLRVIATDNVGVARVVFTVTKPNATTQDVSGADRGDGFYSVMFTVPGNATTEDQTYTVVARLSDAAGNVTETSPQTVVVNSAVAPPSPPPSG